MLQCQVLQCHGVMVLRCHGVAVSGLSVSGLVCKEYHIKVSIYFAKLSDRLSVMYDYVNRL